MSFSFLESIIDQNVIEFNLENHYDLICLLLKADETLFNVAMEKCENKNSVLKNGETFLTNLFKEGYGVETIDNIIDKKIFDANVINKFGESPLVLACQNMMVSTVTKIVQKYPLFPTHKDQAFKTALNIKNKISQSVWFQYMILLLTHCLESIIG